MVKTNERRLYLVLDPDHAVRYPVGVGKSGKQWAGTTQIDGKYRNPAWSPPAEVKHDKPSMPRCHSRRLAAQPDGRRRDDAGGRRVRDPRHQRAGLGRRFRLLRLHPDAERRISAIFTSAFRSAPRWWSRAETPDRDSNARSRAAGFSICNRSCRHSWTCVFACPGMTIDSKIRGDALVLPIAIAGRLRSLRALEFLGRRLSVGRGRLPARFGFGERALWPPASAACVPAPMRPLQAVKAMKDCRSSLVSRRGNVAPLKFKITPEL